jgi:hypothetical protein
VVAPQYIFADPRQSPTLGVEGKGWGFYAELALWVEGRPLRGYFIKAHAGHNSVTFTSALDSLKVPETLLGGMFGSQSIYGGWFTVSAGIGIAYDTQAEERHLRLSNGDYVITKTGPLQNGIDLITQFAIGGSF